jgi:glycosyltransferase involved in cell wall biosynthesis
VIDEMRKSKIFCFSSDYEGMSNALLEAICVGLPVITTNVSGASELVQNGVNGFIVDVRNEEQMVYAMNILLSDADLMTRFSSVNRSQASKYSIDTIVNQWEHLITEVINQYNRNCLFS